MSFAGFTFETDGFADDAATRAENINGIRGHALATFVAAGLKARGFDAGDVYAEDHGWDFDVRGEHAAYHCACSIDDEAPPFEGHITIGKSRTWKERLTGRGGLDPGDAVVAAIRVILEASPEVHKLKQD